MATAGTLMPSSSQTAPPNPSNPMSHPTALSSHDSLNHPPLHHLQHSDKLGFHMSAMKKKKNNRNKKKRARLTHTATTAGAYPWPTSPPLRPSPAPDTSSPVYPGRPIRPMPKRRLRDRLSAEHAANIDYPPEPPSSSPIFQYPYVQEGANDATPVQMQRRGLRAGSHEQVPCVDCGHEHSSMDSEGEEDDVDDRQPSMQFSPDSLQITRRDGDYYGNGRLAHAGATAAASIPTAEWEAKSVSLGSPTSADGYDSIENMSNKKKRKIPQSGIHGHGHSNSLSADMANITISQRDGPGSDPDDGPGSYSGTSYGYAHNSPGGSGGAGVPSSLSGPGRGRFSRSGRGSLDRRPLGASTNGLNAPASHKVPNRPYGKTAPVSGEPGIISAAIANAAQNMPSTPNAKGQENVSMLQQHASKSPPQKTDFTFTPEGGENRPVWPGGQAPPRPSAYSHHPPPPPGAKAAGRPRGTQTSPNPNVNGIPPPPVPGTYPMQAQGGTHPPQPTTAGAHPPPPPPNSGNAQGQPPPKPRKPRSRARTFDIAARQRKLQKEYQNYQNPPKREDIWICEFCEYEAIFGKQPFALIWDYEKKDQAERKRLAERRRLLEKAKMKGRKGKKGSKKNSNNNSNNATAANSHGKDGGQHGAGNQGPLPPNSGHYDDDIGEDDDDEYYDGEYQYDDDEELPPMPQNTPGSFPMDPPPPQSSAGHGHGHHHHHHHHHAHPHSHGAASGGYGDGYAVDGHGHGMQKVEQKYARK